MLAFALLALQIAAAPAPPPAPARAPFPIADAVRQARRASPIRRAAVATSEGATSAWRESGRLPNPLIDLRAENWVPGSTPGLTTPLLDVYAMLAQPIELGGKRESRRNLAAADRNVADAAVRLLDRQITLDTVRTYVQAYRARGLLDVLAVNHDGLHTLVETMRRRVEEGFAPESDLLKFQTEEARVDAEIARVRLELMRSLATLTTLVGADTIDASQLVEPPQMVAPPPEAVDLAAAVGRMPETELARSRVLRARSVRTLEQARQLPDPTVSAGYKRTAGQNTTVVGVTMAVPLFDHNRQAVARATGDEHAAGFELEALTRRLSAEIDALLQAAGALSIRAARAGRELLAPADGVRAASRAAFREGSADILKLIDAERVYGDVQRAALDLRLDAFLAAAEARLALSEEELP